ncbi:DUF3253 domain-containing protein [Acetobacteraceae bacterium H6797]|nr:DUF3253 domain-containing protein [Acetobacteraceae bacterium H6797]
MPTPSPELIAEAILRLTAAAGPTASINPSDVAKELSPEAWRSLLSSVRREAAKLATAGDIEILRKGKPVPPEALHGVVRFRQVAR